MIEEKTMGITTTLKKTYPRKLPTSPLPLGNTLPLAMVTISPTRA